MLKRNGHTAFLLAFLVLLGVIISPVSSQITNVTAPEGKAIWAVSMTAPPESTGAIIIELSDGTSYVGTFSYTGDLISKTANIALNGDTSSTTYVISGNVIPLLLSLWNADNQTAGTRLLKFGYGQIKGIWNDYAQTETKKVPIKKLFLNSNQNIVIDYEYIDYDEAIQILTAKPEESLLGLALRIFPSVISFVSGIFAWIKFLFIDNLLLVIALYISVSMAYSAITSNGNIFNFYKSFFKFQRSMLNFIVELWNYFIQIISAFRGIFKI